MPAYKTQFTSYTPSLLPGDVLQVWNAEQPAPGNGGAAASERVSTPLSRIGPGNYSIDGFFSAAPGAFEIDVEPAVSDVEASYVLAAGSSAAYKIAAVDANNNFHLDVVNFSDKFMRLCLVSRANAVNVTATIRRSA